jgi:hypothetical protein
VRVGSDPAPAGAIVEVLDGAGHTAGRFRVHHPGTLGYLPVYLDDPGTGADEGAELGEWLSVQVDGLETAQVRWSEFGALVELELQRNASPHPTTGLPVQVALTQNQPNPFSPSTSIRFYLPQRDRVSLQVYDVAGRVVRELASGTQDAGHHVVTWDGRDAGGRPAGSGVYLCRLHSGGRQHISGCSTPPCSWPEGASSA